VDFDKGERVRSHLWMRVKRYLFMIPSYEFKVVNSSRAVEGAFDDVPEL
jgi:hypothetical protein